MFNLKQCGKLLKGNFSAMIVGIFLLFNTNFLAAKNTQNLDSTKQPSEQGLLVAGAMAPNFKLAATNGKEVSLSEYIGSNVILYFYPKDGSPFCTKEASSFTKLSEEFKKLNTCVIGISRDTVVSHKKFKDKYNLDFPLLSDENGDVSRLYGVLEQSNKNGWSKRTTFLINTKGIIVKVWQRFNVFYHANDVLEAVKKLNY